MADPGRSLNQLADSLPAQAAETGGDLTQQRRRLLADLCKMVGQRLGTYSPRQADEAGLSPRMRQTLQCLLDGDSEKQIAGKLKLSRHTVHVYVKALYKHFNVCSRGELLSRILRGPSGDTPNR